MTWRVEDAEPVSHPTGVTTAAAWILRQLEVVSTLDAMLAWDPTSASSHPAPACSP